VVAGCVLALTACGPMPVVPSSPTVPSPPATSGVPTPGGSGPEQPTQEVTTPISPTVPMPSSPGLSSLVSKAMGDLAQRLGIDPDQIDLVELKPVVWPDGSLGCPQPGMEYTQVPVEGLLIRLQAGGRVYEYHSGGGQAPFLCEHPF
jgi:hypothetical protein